MLNIEFSDGSITTAIFKSVKDGVVSLTGSGVNNLSGFMAYSQNGILLGDYSGYTTKYNTYTEVPGGILLSTGETEAAPPAPIPPKTEATVTFAVSGTGALTGDTSVVVSVGTDAGSLTLPSPEETDPMVEFKNWSPEIAGTINDDITYTAIFDLKPEFTLEARVTTAEECLMEMAEIVYA